MGLWNLLDDVAKTLFGSAHAEAPSHRVIGEAQKGDRSYRFETLEEREMLNADPLFLGGVYIENDPGSDTTGGDTFEISFTGGAPGTQLTSLLIDGNHDGLPTIGTNDMIFDTVQQDVPNLTDALGKGAAFPFTIVQKIGDFDVTASVQDGSTQLLLTFTNFDAGDKLIFSIDVDEINNIANGPVDGLDEVASGIEWHGSTLTGNFNAPHYQNATLGAVYHDNYAFSGTSLDLSPNNVGATPQNPNGVANRTAGGYNQMVQEPLPIAISGRVYHDRDLDLTIDPTDSMLPGVTLELWKQVNGSYVDTGFRAITNATGDYKFGQELGLAPGTYQVREQQPTGYLSVGAVPGTVDGVTSGQIVPGNRDVLTEISIPLGGTESIHNDFAECKPVTINGYVYHDRNNNGIKEAGEEGIPGVVIQVQPIATISAQNNVFVTTDENGFYQATGLAPGSYNVIETQQPVPYLDGLDTPGTVNGLVVGTVNNLTGGEHLNNIQLASEQAGINYNFGELLPVEIHGHVHLTTPDGDCFAPEGEVNVPLENVLIQLYDGNGNFVAETHTNAAGDYSFVALPPGTYKVVEFTPVGLLDSGDHIGQVNGNLVGTNPENDVLANIVLTSGQVGVHYDFCESLPAQLSGYVYHDRDNDGVKDAGEEGIPETTVELIVTSWNVNGGPANQQVLGSTTTNSVGYYEFLNLPRLHSGLDGDIMKVYSVRETQPAGWKDGKDTAGTVGGQTRGTALNDIIHDLELKFGETGINYNFGELKPGSIAGWVMADKNKDCIYQEGEWYIEGVKIDLLDANGNVIATTFTDVNGKYKFDNLDPGTYSVFEHQPTGYFTSDEDAGHEVNSNVIVGEDSENLLSVINVGSGDEMVEYHFCETPPSEISGYVFIDGPDIQLAFGQSFSPQNVPAHSNGQLTPDDRRLPGVWLELRDGITGRPIMGSEALPGIYGNGPIRVQTDANGYYHFGGLAAGNYAVFEIQPGPDLIDGLDTPGTQSGIAINVNSIVGPNVLSTLTVSPHDDAILRIALPPGVHAQQNNFSEVKVERPPVFFEPPPPPTPPPLPPGPPQPIPVTPPPPQFQMLDIKPPLITGGALGYTWHLSVVDAGLPRQLQTVDEDLVQAVGTHFSYIAWDGAQLREASWKLADRGDTELSEIRDHIFGIPGAIPVAGDFNGDGQSESGIYYRGEWFIDLNGNGKWDEGDLWANLGTHRDKPVVGDWDGDGKDDIGIFGPAWPGDPRAIEHDPGLPDPDNPVQNMPRQKNVPPKLEEATLGHRSMQLTARGKVRADLIDHVFHYGTAGDVPVVGDWNGDGIDTIAIFRNGRWNLDMDGDGRWTPTDKLASFGQKGDIPVVGDWNGDGLDEIGVYRAGKWYLDTNRNFELDATDAVYDLGGEGDLPTVGDWNGDGKDDIGVYHSEGPVRDIGVREG